MPMITFDTDPTRYRHWRLACDGPIATLTLDVEESGGLSPDYRLKLNSYDLGVDRRPILRNAHPNRTYLQATVHRRADFAI